MRVIFHIGMGKTGTTTIQKTLAQSRDSLLSQGTFYLGQWMDVVSPSFGGFDGFQRFLAQEPADLRESAWNLLSRMRAGPENFLFSNEQILDNLEILREFFQIIAEKAELKILIYVRPPATWLPSAYAQWGIAHKVNEGPVLPFIDVARQLLERYDHVRLWREAFGEAVVVRPFQDGLDVVQDFALTTGVTLVSPQREQMRLLPEELLLRAAYNTRLVEPQLPDEFNRTMGALYTDFPASVTEKVNYLFDFGAVPAIIRERAGTIGYLEREFGIDLTSGSVSEPRPVDKPALIDALVGHLVDLVVRQGHQIRQLEERVSDLESH